MPIQTFVQRFQKGDHVVYRSAGDNYRWRVGKVLEYPEEGEREVLKVHKLGFPDGKGRGPGSDPTTERGRPLHLIQWKRIWKQQNREVCSNVRSGPKVEVILEPRDVLLEVELTKEGTLQRYDIEMLSKAGQGHPHPDCRIE